jgi:hypothetical protein
VTKPRLVLCSGAKLARGERTAGRKVLQLDSIGKDPNVHIQFENVASVFNSNLPHRLIDLVEIAAYIYTADCATDRGKTWELNAIEQWSRNFEFRIPVRDIAFWNRAEIRTQLADLLHFLSDDIFQFEFSPLDHDRSFQDYLDLSDNAEWPFLQPERVLMFSGGLDSLAGAVETAAAGKNIVLVSHRSFSPMDARQKGLVQAFKNKYPDVKVLHVPVWINKQTSFGREASQRTRSFLFGALGLAVAASTGAAGVRFFENGIVSLNLPVADEVLRARASRTTHPITLHQMQQLFSLILARPAEVDNPYLYLTKTEVVGVLKKHDAGDLVPYSCSCAHSMFKSRQQWHCGVCSQCIDRRVAIIAGGLGACESETDYESDVFVGPRKDGYERNIGVDYVRHGLELNRMHETDLAQRFSVDWARATRFVPHKTEAVRELMDLHKRHGAAVDGVLRRQVELHAPKIVDPGIEPSSMLATVIGGEHREPNWRRYCGRIIGLLQAGIPISCQSRKPEDEKHLQEIADGILKAADMDLFREFPFMRWASRLTKPDWSSEPFRLFVELKYIRKREHVLRVTEEIAADITKYGDSGRRVLFVVYDPFHVITDEADFSKEIRKRETTQFVIIR